MNDATSDFGTPQDFGTGLRAHLGLERGQLDLVAEPDTQPQPVATAPMPEEITRAA